MERKDFFKIVNRQYRYTEKDFTDNITFNLTECESESYYNKRIDGKRSLYFIKLVDRLNKEFNIKLTLSDLSEIDLKIKQDYYQMEYYGNFVYNVIYNANELYDLIVEKLNLSKEEKVIYRIENSDSRFKLKTNVDPIQAKEIALVFYQRNRVFQACDYKKNWRFGFSNIEQLTKRLSEKDLENANKSGLKIVKYKVPDKFTLSSDKQIIFKKSKAQKIEELNPLDKIQIQKRRLK